MIGRKLGRYEIAEAIGAGGMGEVYRALDTELERPVAIKVLPTGTVPDESARKRLRREALALAKLRHPHIGVIHDFGSSDEVDYLVMELVPGDNLSTRLADGPLPEAEVVALGIQVAQALEEAHEQNIVHRDLKPHNIMVTPKGHAKVLDFGLAKLVRPLDEATTASMTEIQSLAGTLPYMAPEQLQEGAEVDARTDIYALGVTLYEMAAGRRPFDQTTAPRLMSAILRDDPPMPRSLQSQLSSEFEKVVMKAMQRDPSRRYATAEELRTDLERLARGLPVAAPKPRPRSTKRLMQGALLSLLLAAAGFWLFHDRLSSSGVRYASLAVLPFENYTGDDGEDPTVDYMSSEVIAKLGPLIDKVSAWQSVKRFRSTDLPLRRIGDELGVEAIVSAQVVRTDSRLRLTVNLIDVATEAQVWAQSYEGGLEDVLESHLNAAVLEIAQEISLPLADEERSRLEARKSVDTEAIRLYASGRYAFEQQNSEAFVRAVEFFNQAIDIDSTFAKPYAGLADVYSYWSWGIYAAGMQRGEARELALEFARKALALDAALPEAHASLGWAFASRWQHDEAEAAFRRALEIDPNYAFTHQAYGHLLSWRGRHDEAVRQLRQAEALAPIVPMVVNQVSWTLYYAGRFDESIEQCRKALQLNPNFAMAHYNIGLGLEAKGDLEEAIANYERAIEIQGPEGLFKNRLACAYAAMGQTAEAWAAVREFEERLQAEDSPPSALVELYVLLGETDKAFETLETLYEQRYPWLGMLRAETVRKPYQALASDPRFEELLERIGI